MIPKVVFKNLKGYPDLQDEENIPVELFLNASKEIISIIESFGQLFRPVVSDMSGNLASLETCYYKDTSKYYYLQDLVIENKHTASAILWLKRALELIANFFLHVLRDDKESENLRNHLNLAYEKTLKPYHGWMTQTAFSIIYRWTPQRSELIGSGTTHEENIAMLRTFLPKMERNLLIVDTFLKQNKLDDTNKV